MSIDYFRVMPTFKDYYADSEQIHGQEFTAKLERLTQVSQIWEYMVNARFLGPFSSFPDEFSCRYRCNAISNLLRIDGSCSGGYSIGVKRSNRGKMYVLFSNVLMTMCQRQTYARL